MSVPQMFSRLALGLVIAACCLGQVMAGGGEKAGPQMPPDGALKPSIEMRNDFVANDLVERKEDTAVSVPESKGVDHREQDRRDVLLLLLLQILRSPL
jgi:hypothetical protein